VQNDLNVFRVRQNFNDGVVLGDEGDTAAAATDVMIEKDASAVLGVRTGTDSAYASIKCLSLETTSGVTPISARTRWATGFTQVAATSGTDTACDNGSVWAAQVYVGENCTLTGIEYLIGSVGGTDKVIAYLFDSTGVVVANSALAGATVGTAATLQQVAFTATYAAKGPQTYIVGLQFNGTTAKFRTIPAYTGQESMRIKQTGGVFGTSAPLSPVATALTDAVGPVLSTY
jgi:hypothetical protein